MERKEIILKIRDILENEQKDLTKASPLALASYINRMVIDKVVQEVAEDILSVCAIQQVDNERTHFGDYKIFAHLCIKYKIDVDKIRQLYKEE